MKAHEIKLRTSERSTFARCEFKWYLGYHLALKPRQTGPALRFGTAIHEALAGWYVPETRRKPGTKAKRGVHPVKGFLDFMDKHGDFAIRGIKAEDDDTEEDVRHEARELGEEMLTNYIDHYGRDDHWCIVAPEMAFKIPVHDKSGKFMYWYVGTGDGVALDLNTGKLIMLEHKTTAGTSVWKLDMDEQAGSYWAFVPEFLRSEGILGPEETLSKVEYNFLMKAKKDTRPQNAQGQYLNKPVKDALVAELEKHVDTVKKSMKIEDLMEALTSVGVDPLLLGEPSKKQPPPLFFRHSVFRAEGEATALKTRANLQFGRMQRIRAGKMKPLKSILDGCSGMFSCEYREVCQLHEIKADWRGFARATMTTWDPYEIHNTSDETGYL